MPRTYEREEIKWDLDTLRALAALEPPQATFFEKANRWVVKTPEGSFGIRPEQIVDNSIDWEAEEAQAEGERQAELAYERYLEDGGPHAASIAAEDEEERRREALDVGLQQQRALRAEYVAQTDAEGAEDRLRAQEQADDARPATDPTLAELDDLMKHFGA